MSEVSERNKEKGWETEGEGASGGWRLPFRGVCTEEVRNSPRGPEGTAALGAE